jgi:phosphomannomutase/phosphoglucomutase
MNQAIFRAYSIRGIVDETLNADDMLLIGQAASTLLGRQGITMAVVGHDYRTSSPQLAAALKIGLSSAGMDVIDIGACPTPMLNFATDYYRAGAGFMVTASHNPPRYNGVKIRTDHTLCAGELHCIYQIAVSRDLCHGQGTIVPADPVEAYVDAICERAHVTRALHLVVDAGNGAAGPFVPQILDRLGCQVISLYCQPDGGFPNRVPDPTAPGALADLSARVVAEQADAGLAYDGDADRLVMVDETGQVVFADQLLALLARDALPAHPGARIVYEVSCTQALPETIVEMGGVPIPCPVGYAFVHEALRETRAILGGEAAGHIFFADPDFQFDDALLATARVISLLSRVDEPFSALLAQLPHYVLSDEHRLYCPDDVKARVVAKVHDRFGAQGFEIETIDGAKVYFTQHGRTQACGWGLFRSSNTQPAVTLRCEAQTPEQLVEIETLLLGAVHEELSRVGIEPKSAHT